MARTAQKAVVTEDGTASRQGLLELGPESGGEEVLELGRQTSQFSNKEYRADKYIEQFFPSDEAPETSQVSPMVTKVMTWVIILNTIQTGAECQWKPQDSPTLRHFYLGLDIIFVTLFLGECILKLKVLGSERYFAKGWNIMDFVLTVVMIFDIVGSAIEESSHQEYTALHSIGRAFRLARCFRLIRVLRVLKAQPELLIVTGGLIKSSRALVWILVLLLCIMYFFAIFFVLQLDHTIFTEAGGGTKRMMAHGTAAQEVDETCGPGEIAVTDGGHEMCRAATTCEQDKYFCNLVTAMASLLDVVVGAEWSGIVHPILHRQTWMMLPFIIFFMCSAFGVLNVIVGVIVDATAETKSKMDWQDKREELRYVSRQWEDIITNSGLSLAELNNLSGEERQKKVDQRHGVMTKLIQEVIDSGVVNFPQAVRPQNIINLLKRNKTDELNQEDFTVVLGRLMLGDQQTLLYQSLINTSKLHYDLHDQMEKVHSQMDTLNERFDKLEAMLEGMHKPARSE
eukprot:TRINITY_DN11151_c0_g1_i4.p1 TRINITY_DN11151_c0_g1~~TRINITY_DN11151_c0_g1_i4.p1  ORF type:complete len:523 (-),score=81.55 TRINITY_DN11151_c0_g1_i4:49-1584(-)